MFNNEDNRELENDLTLIKRHGDLQAGWEEYRPDAEMHGTGFEWLIKATFVSLGFALAVGLGYLSANWLAVFALIPIAELNRRRKINKRMRRREKHYQDYIKSRMIMGDPRFWGRGTDTANENHGREE